MAQTLEQLHPVVLSTGLPSADQILNFAQQCLVQAFQADQSFGAVPIVNALLRAPLERVNVTLRTGGHLRGSMSSPGNSLAEQIHGAIMAATRDRRFYSRVVASEIDRIDLEVWLQVASLVVGPAELISGHFLDLGVEGAEIRLGTHSAYYKPSVAITSGKRTLVDFMAGVCRKAGLAGDDWKKPEAVVLRTQWLRFASAPALRGAAQAESKACDPSLVQHWLQASAHYLLNARLSEGDFVYLYDPVRDVEILEAPSRVRSAGCLYALSQYLDSSYADDNLAAAEAIHTLASAQVKRTRHLDGFSRVMPEARSALLPKLGATALLTLALGGSTLRCSFQSAHAELYRSLIAAQKPDGRFLTHFGEDTENLRSSEFFSGQALLACVQAAELGDTEALQLVARAFQPYRQQWKTMASSAFAGWHVDVWSRMALLTNQPHYADFAYEQADWLLQMQLTDPPERSWTGGFSAKQEIPKFSSIVFLESVVRAFTLANSRNDTKRRDRYRTAILLGLDFCATLRIAEERSSWFPNPKRSRGGIALSPLNYAVRCDVPQHFITLCLQLLATEQLF